MAYDEGLAERTRDLTGRSMRGVVHVGEEGLSEDEDLAVWLDRGQTFAGSLPPKQRVPR